VNRYWKESQASRQTYKQQMVSCLFTFHLPGLRFDEEILQCLTGNGRTILFEHLQARSNETFAQLLHCDNQIIS
jgi:hypothetical protein